MTANVTRDSYQDGKNYVEVTFQTRKDVLDSELNEVQKIARARLAKALTTVLGGVHAVGIADGGRVTSDGVTANTIIIKAGVLTAAGYAVSIAADLTVTGLTTPGSPRTDDVWLGISETDIGSSVDPAIAVQKLGETTHRQQTTITIIVDQGGSSPPSSTAVPYLGGTQYVQLARIYRTATAVVAASTCVDFRSRSVAHLLAQDRNMMIRATGVSWNGTTLAFTSLVVRLPDEPTGFWSMANLSVTPADGNAVGWLGSTAANRLRRRVDVATIGQNATPSEQNDNIATLVAFNALTALSGQFAHSVLVLAVRDGTQVILRDGTILNSGDYMHSWGVAGGVQATAEGDANPLVVYRSYLGKLRSLVDHTGYRMGEISEIDENWKLAAVRSLVFSTINMIEDAAAALPAGEGWNGLGFIVKTNGDSVAMPLNPLAAGPVTSGGSTITQCTVFYNRTDATVRYLLIDKGTAGTATSIVAKDVSAGTGATSTNIGSAPTVGGLPYTVTQLSNLAFGANVTVGGATGQVIYCVQLAVINDPPGWVWSPGTPVFSVAAASQAQRTYQDATSALGLNQRSLNIASGLSPGSAQDGVMTTEGYEAFMDANIDFVMEWVCRTGTISDASNVRSFKLGVQSNNGGSANRFIYLFNSNTTANWQLRIAATANSDTDTGVAIAANTIYRIRLEIKGSSTSSAGANAFRVKLYINGVLTTNVTTNTAAGWPAADMIRPFFAAGTTAATGGPYDFSVGRIRRCFNHLLTQDAL